MKYWQTNQTTTLPTIEMPRQRFGEYIFVSELKIWDRQTDRQTDTGTSWFAPQIKTSSSASKEMGSLSLVILFHPSHEHQTAHLVWQLLNYSETSPDIFCFTAKSGIMQLLLLIRIFIISYKVSHVPDSQSVSSVRKIVKNNLILKVMFWVIGPSGMRQPWWWLQA